MYNKALKKKTSTIDGTFQSIKRQSLTTQTIIAATDDCSRQLTYWQNLRQELLTQTPALKLPLDPVISGAILMTMSRCDLQQEKVQHCLREEVEGGPKPVLALANLGA
ncbi:hypothetical protein TIFTF001_042841 [Ficus carica]|uniref:Uncharacterized protein n=1 Tax=Ficus carica TaxID=3494 RepID=A0AA87YNX8_FICCA|nr:hypothetical protein TIFTF001_042841 [Ficus carica]